jgi:hypothetical protein
VEWTLVAVTQIHESPLTGAVQTQELPGAYWQCVVDYSNAWGDNARKLAGFSRRVTSTASNARPACKSAMRARMA